MKQLLLCVLCVSAVVGCARHAPAAPPLPGPPAPVWSERSICDPAMEFYHCQFPFDGEWRCLPTRENGKWTHYSLMRGNRWTTLSEVWDKYLDGQLRCEAKQ